MARCCWVSPIPAAHLGEAANGGLSLFNCIELFCERPCCRFVGEAQPDNAATVIVPPMRTQKSRLLPKQGSLHRSSDRSAHIGNKPLGICFGCASWLRGQ